MDVKLLFSHKGGFLQKDLDMPAPPVVGMYIDLVDSEDIELWWWGSQLLVETVTWIATRNLYEADLKPATATSRDEIAKQLITVGWEPLTN